MNTLPNSVACSISPSVQPVQVDATRVRALDGVRGLAILLVMWHHFTVVQGSSSVEWYLRRLATFGTQGVDLFFVLSGFLITGILIGTKSRPSFFRNFYMRRTLRIFPLYYAVVLLSIVILPWLLSLSPRFSVKSLRMGAVSQDVWWYLTYTSNLLIAWKHDWRHGVLGVTWSLAIEEQYYLVWAVVVYLTSLRTLKRLCVSMIFFAPLLRVVLFLSGWQWMQIYVFTFCRIDALAWGSLLAVICRQPWDERQRFNNWFYRALLLMAPPLLLWIICGWQYDHRAELTAGYSLVGLCFAALLSVIVAGKHLLWLRRLFETRAMVFLGKYSYALYLFHLPIRAAIRDIWFSKAFLYSSGAKAALYQFLFFGVAMLACIPPALVSWNLFEKHFLKLKERFS